MYGPAIARMITQWNFPSELARAKKIAGVLLRFMDEHLKSRSFLAAEHATIADLACYSYIAHAPEGGVPLVDYSSVLIWLRRVEALPKFKPIPPSPVPPEA
jgi:glutathione S-transferase